MSPSVFISYRHRDAAFVRGLQIELESRLTQGSVIRDVKSILGGDDLRSVIPEQLQRADIVVAVVGPSWATADPHGQVFERVDDWVRFELSLALAWRKRIIPILVGGAGMPLKRQLPRDVQALADLVAIPVRDSDWDNDIAKFVDLIDPTSHARAKPSPTVTDAGPVAGGNISMVGDIVAGRDIGRLPPAQ